MQRRQADQCEQYRKGEFLRSCWLRHTRTVNGGEYSGANLNGRLIDGGKLMANVEHVTFAAARVKQFNRVFSVDLFAQAVHVDLDRI